MLNELMPYLVFYKKKIYLNNNENLIISEDFAKFIEYMFEYDKINSFI